MTKSVMPYGTRSATSRAMRVAAYGAGVLARKGVKYAAKKAFSRSGSKNGSSSGAVTYQHDTKSVYRRKRMPYRKRKRWTGFVKKVRAIEFKDHASNHVVRAYSSPTIVVSHTGSSSQGAQSMTNVGLYGISNEAENYSIAGDLIDIWTEWCGTNPTAVLSQKMCFTTAISDVYITNTGTTTLIVDVYESYCRKDMTYAQGAGLFDTVGLSNFPNDQTGEKQLNASTFGVTPFQLPNYTTYFKIANKTKHVISPGNVVTWQCRDTRNRVIRGEHISPYYQSYVAKKGLTRFWTIVATTPDGATSQDGSYKITQSRTYNFKVLDQSAERGRFLAV